MRTNKEIAADLRRLADELDLPIVKQQIDVSDAASLTAALDTAPEGTVILLKPGNYVGQFEANHSLTLVCAPGAVIETNTNQPALHVTGDNVILSGVNLAGPRADDILVLSGKRSAVIDSSITGGGNTKRGIRLEGPEFTIARNKITNIFRVGQDSQAIAGWDTPGQGIIEDNILEAASENILFGGADPTIAGTIPSDIVIRRNILRKQLSWLGKGYVVKNLLELKSARRVSITDNVMENNWKDGQVGFAIVLTPVNQDGNHPAAEISDVLFENNVIKNTAASIQMARNGYKLEKVTFRNNLFEATGISSPKNILLLGGMDRLVFENNTFRYARRADSSTIYAYDGNITNFRFVRNLVRLAGDYGICAQGNCNGRLWQQFFPGGVIEENAFEGFPSPANLPASNLHLASGAVDPAGYGKQ